MQWNKYFNIPLDANLSLESENLIRKLISSPGIVLLHLENRLGSYGIEAIKYHPFFANIDWNNIKNSKAPFIPRVFNF